MYLTGTVETLQVILAGAVTTNQSVVTVDYGENTATTFVAGKQRSVTNGSAAVDILAAPSAASTQRIVQFLTMTNADTAAITVTIQTNNAGTLATQFGPVTLLPSERVEFATDTGFRVYDAAGAMKGAASQFVVGTYVLSQLTANQNFSAAAFTTIVYNNEVSDALGEYNPATGETTIKNTGRYLLSAYAAMEAGADGATIAISIFRNGSEFMRVGNDTASNPSSNPGFIAQVGGTTFANLTVGDVITLRGFVASQVGGGTLRFLGLSQLTNFSMMRMG